MGGACSTYGERREKNLERKLPHGRPRRRWKNDIKMDLQEVRCGGIDWIELVRIGTGGGHL